MVYGVHKQTTLLAFLVAILIAAPSRGASATPGVSLDRYTFNPSSGERISLKVTTPPEARVSVAVLDRDGYVARWLATEHKASGTYVLTWDGRDADGSVVANEAYSFKVDVVSPSARWTYFPAANPTKTHTVQAKHYSRRNAALMYDLPSSCRIHAQAGSAKVGDAKASRAGVVLKTLVNREPRPAGAIVESWNGLDESGTIYVPDLPHFVTAILATELPENAVIAYGNRTRTFLDTAVSRRGISLLPPPRDGTHTHHHGLPALSDTSPSLVVIPLNGTWNAQQRAWVVEGDTVLLSVRLDGPTAGLVARQPGKIIAFVDYTQQSERTVRKGAATIATRLGVLSGGPHVVSINWQSDHGPLAANSIRVITADNSTAANPSVANRGSESR